MDNKNPPKEEKMADNRQPMSVEDRFKEAMGTVGQAERKKTRGDAFVNFLASGGWVLIVLVVIALIVILSLLLG